MKRIRTTLFFLFLVSLPSAGQITAPPSLGIMPKAYISCFTAIALTVDGRLDEDAWNNVPWTDDFVDIQGALKPPPRFRTRVKMLWDSTYFYVGAELEEPDVWGTLTKRDTVIFYDDDFEIFMDPDGDHHEYYEMEMNALNTVWDLFLPRPYKDSGKAQDSWDIRGLRTAVHVEGTINTPGDRDRGWTVEVAMPWAALKEYAHRPAPPGEGDQWRINFSRVEWQVDTAGGLYRKRTGLPEDNWVWSPQGVIDMHRPEMWGYVQFTKHDSAHARFRPDPAFSAQCFLDRIYYAQRAFHETKKRYASSIQELETFIPMNVRTPEKPVIRLSVDGYTASLRVRSSAGGAKSGWTEWHITQDARLSLNHP